MTFNEILQQYVNSSYEELVSIARNNLSTSLPALEKALDNKENTATFLLILFGTCIGADGELSALEVSFVNDVFGMDWNVDSILDTAKTCNNDDTRALLDNIIDSLDNDTKIALCSFCICAMSVDETISSREVQYISKLLD